jgi:hypothetical protein
MVMEDGQAAKEERQANIDALQQLTQLAIGNPNGNGDGNRN